jgi:phenylalanyl-tRNA synthetase beta chain
MLALKSCRTKRSLRVNSVKAKEIEEVTIFDVYRGTGIPEGCKSVGIRIRYRSYDRTLTDDEISALHRQVTDGLINKLKVALR